MIKKIEKKVFLPNYGVNLDIDLAIPVENPTTDEKEDEFIKDAMVNQITRSLTSALESYRINKLPTSFTKGQELVVTTDLAYDTPGLFDRRTDIIYLDPNYITICMRSISPSFILGHEMGHKIDKYRDTTEVYDQIADFFGISRYNEHVISEIYSDIVGNIAARGYNESPDRDASDELIYHAEEVLTPEESTYIKKRVLHSIYKG